jgi:fibro-slime domain-containing protein
MANWTVWVVCGALLGAVSCGDENGDSGDGGGSGGGDDAGSNGSLDGSMDGGRRDSGVRDGGGLNLFDGGDCSNRTLKIRIRDFKESHPDFENFSGDTATTGIVKNDLGADKKPVFNESRGMVDSAESFSQWYNDTPNFNQTIMVERTLSEITVSGKKAFQYADSAFFPIDDMGFKNEGNTDDDGNSHNYHFTTEIHTLFTYQRGQRFQFKGDDDLWIFVNGKLALDLGGLHSELEGTIDFDAKAAELGIVPGETYPMDIFHAERHTVHSRFTITTNIECFVNVIVI